MGVFSTSASVAVPLVWNGTTGNFVSIDAWSYNNAGAVATTSNPFDFPGGGSNLGGENIVMIGNGGVVTLDTPDQGPFDDNSIYELRIGTASADANFSGLTPPGPNLQGNGTLTVSNVDLTLFDTDPSSTTDTGRLIIGGSNGIEGTMNWNSTGTLTMNGHLRIGQDGTGTLNQNGGIIRVATTIGTDRDMHIGNNNTAGGGDANDIDATLNLNDGLMELGAANDGTGIPARRLLEIGQDNNTTGIFNLGDGIGASSSAKFETWSSVRLGPDSGDGILNIKSDGALIVNYGVAGSSELNIGPGGGAEGAIVQEGGIVDTDGLLRMGSNTADASYTLIGSTGSVNVRSVLASATSTFAFELDAGGATKITVEGSTNTAGDNAAGNIISLSNSTLNITGLNNWTSSNSIILFEQLDADAVVNGSFGNRLQGEIVGQNASSQDFYLNLFGGNGNDIVLQSTPPPSNTLGIVWNAGAANMDAGWVTSNGAFGVGASADPFAGVQNLHLGNGGTATYNAATNDAAGSLVKNLYVGTHRSASFITDTDGDGTLTVDGSENLTTDDAAGNAVNGQAYIGEAGHTGTLNWNSTGTFDAQGQLRIGRTGGTGIVNQNNGIVQGGFTAGGGKYLAVGENAGSHGTYNLNSGAFYPDGQGYRGAANRLRQLRVGIDGATGIINVGDGIGAAGTAILESEDDLWIGSGGGNGTLNIKSDGVVRLLKVTTVTPNVDSADFLVGRAGGTGLVVQDGGSVVSNALFSIGEGNGSTGEYRLNGGTLQAAADGSDAMRIGGGGGNGKFTISGTASLTQGANLVVAQGDGSGSVGLLELSGSDASFQVNRLENHRGNNETIRWVADAEGVTPIVVTQAGAGNRVQLQSSAVAPDPLGDLQQNTGTNGGPDFSDLMGNGTALSLDLSALTGNHVLTLIDHRDVTAKKVQGFFEDGTTGNLFEEGESILGTGYIGTVTISYLGTAAGALPTSIDNDIVLTLIALPTFLSGDHNHDGVVDAADYVMWRKTNGNGPTGYTDWVTQFGQTSPGSGGEAEINLGNVPEPAGAVLFIFAMFSAAGFRRRAIV